jgi:hypothetical protein
VEQKNWTHVRKLVGYHRLSGERQYRLLKDLYRVWSLWRNYFQPVMRLESKTRTGSKVHRRYDVPPRPASVCWLRASSARWPARAWNNATQA